MGQGRYRRLYHRVSWQYQQGRWNITGLAECTDGFFHYCHHNTLFGIFHNLFQPDDRRINLLHLVIPGRESGDFDLYQSYSNLFCARYLFCFPCNRKCRRIKYACSGQLHYHYAYRKPFCFYHPGRWNKSHVCRLPCDIYGNSDKRRFFSFLPMES